MNWKKILAFSFSLLYLILISLFIYFSRIEIICGFSNPCLRFCSSDTEKFSNKVLFDEFMDSNFSKWYEYSDFDRISFYRGPLFCNGKIEALKIVEKEHGDDDDDDDYVQTMKVYEASFEFNYSLMTFIY